MTIVNTVVNDLTGLSNNYKFIYTHVHEQTHTHIFYFTILPVDSYIKERSMYLPLRED